MMSTSWKLTEDQIHHRISGKKTDFLNIIHVNIQKSDAVTVRATKTPTDFCVEPNVSQEMHSSLHQWTKAGLYFSLVPCVEYVTLALAAG